MTETPLKFGFIGAGKRATLAHYPSFARLEGATIEAVCELDKDRLSAVADQYDIPGRYGDYKQMLATADIDAVVAIMPPQPLAGIVIDCLNAGKHVYMEKPPAMNPGEVATMIEAAEKNRRLTMVCFQRRFTSVVAEARRQVGWLRSPTMCMAEFHKCRLKQTQTPYGVNDMLIDVIHVVDLVRYLCGGEVVETKSFHGSFFNNYTNSYNSMIRFDNDAVGIVTANRATGGRNLRLELHGRGLAAYADIPDRLEIQRDYEAEPTVVSGQEIARREGVDDWEGTPATHRHFLSCIRRNELPLTSLQDAFKTMQLVEMLGG